MMDSNRFSSQVPRSASGQATPLAGLAADPLSSSARPTKARAAAPDDDDDVLTNARNPVFVPDADDDDIVTKARNPVYEEAFLEWDEGEEETRVMKRDSDPPPADTIREAPRSRPAPPPPPSAALAPPPPRALAISAPDLLSASPKPPSSPPRAPGSSPAAAGKPLPLPPPAARAAPLPPPSPRPAAFAPPPRVVDQVSRSASGLATPFASPTTDPPTPPTPPISNTPEPPTPPLVKVMDALAPRRPVPAPPSSGGAPSGSASPPFDRPVSRLAPPPPASRPAPSAPGRVPVPLPSPTPATPVIREALPPPRAQVQQPAAPPVLREAPPRAELHASPAIVAVPPASPPPAVPASTPSPAPATPRGLHVAPPPPPPPVPQMPVRLETPPPPPPPNDVMLAIPPFSIPPTPRAPVEAVSSLAPAATTVVEPTAWSKVGAMLGALSLVVSIGLGVFLLWPREGRLRVELDVQGGAPVARAEVFVDGHKRCDVVPCVVHGVPAGARTIQISSSELETTSVTSTVEAGGERSVVVPVRLAARAGGLKVTGSQPGVKVFLNGVDVGPLPQSLKDIPAGMHKLAFDGGERYQRIEKTIEVRAGQVVDAGEVRLDVKRGRVVIDVGTRSASVTLVAADGSKKTLRGPWPVTLDLDAARGWKLRASASGHRDMEADLSFADGNPEVSLRVDLAKDGESAVAAPAPEPAAKPAKAAPAQAEPDKKKDEPTAAANEGPGTLNINSLPPSKVMLDGTPVGQTPLVGLSVAPGSHTITFVHPELGKKSVSVEVRGGQKAVASVRFKTPEATTPADE